MVMPGDNIEIDRDANSILLLWKKVMRFAIREGGRTIGAGTVTKIIE